MKATHIGIGTVEVRTSSPAADVAGITRNVAGLSRLEEGGRLSRCLGLGSGGREGEPDEHEERKSWELHVEDLEILKGYPVGGFSRNRRY